MHRRHEPIATREVYYDDPAIYDGATSAQIFVEFETLLAGVHDVKSDNKFSSKLTDDILQYDTMGNVIINCAQVQISNKVKNMIRSLFIDD